MNHKPKIKFAAEKTLGKLTKWLRLLGFDTVYEQDTSYEMFREALKSGYIFLTRTTRFRDAHLLPKVIFINSDLYADQLKEVILALGISRSDLALFSRCLSCNLPIKKVDKNAMYGKVPDYIWETHDSFQICTRCGRVYWPGSHTEQSQERIDRLFEP
ncbi:Mut7-C RNAse domain-containing protein [Thermodesulfobacteriota bacterium]